MKWFLISIACVLISNTSLVAQSDSEVAQKSQAKAAEFLQSGKVADAIKVTQAALDSIGKDSVTERASLLCDLGNYYLQDRNEAEAESRLRQAIDLLKDNGKLESELGALAHALLGTLQFRKNKLKLARTNLETSVHLLKQAGVPEIDPRMGGAHNQLSFVTYSLRDFEATERHLIQVLKISVATNGNSHPKTIASLRSYVNFLSGQGRKHDAKDYSSQILNAVESQYGIETAQASRAHLEYAVLIRSIDFNEALEHAQQALSTAIKLKPAAPVAVSSAHYGLGICYQSVGDLAQARFHLKQAVDGFGQDVNEYSVNALIALSEVSHQLYDYPEAIAMSERALNTLVNTEGKNSPRTGNAHLTLANALGKTSRQQEADANFQRGIAILEQSRGYKHPDTIMAYGSYGSWLSNGQDLDRALVYLEATVKLIESEGESFGRSGLANGYRNSLASAQELSGDFVSALSNYRRSFGWISTQVSPASPSYTGPLHNLSVSELQNGNSQRAIQFQRASRRGIQRHINKLLGGLPKQDQLQFLDKLYRLRFHVALSFLMNEYAVGKGGERRQELAVETAEWMLNGKALTLDILSRRQRRGLSDDTHLVNALGETRELLTALVMSKSEETNVQRKILELTQKETSLSRNLGAKSELDSRPWTSIPQIQSVLKDNEVLIEFARYDAYNFAYTRGDARYFPARYAVWIIPASGAVRVVDLGEANRIETAIGELHRLYSSPEQIIELIGKEGEAVATEQWDQEANRVADLVWKPIKQFLPESAEKLILSPDSSLWLVPWSALPISGDGYLLEEFGLQYVVSGRELIREQAETVAASKPVIIANPDFELSATDRAAAIEAEFGKVRKQDSVLDSIIVRGVTDSPVRNLPFTKLEAEAVLPRMGEITDTDVESYTDDRALESVLKTVKNPRFLMLSTHGFALGKQVLDENRPIEDPLLRCGLLFAGYNSKRSVGFDDGIVTGLDIINLPLQGTELVVLSACESAAGQVDNGEGLAGLRQAFQIAGAESVVAALWQVPDRDTAIVVSDFFSQIAAGISRDEAIRRAQLKRLAGRKERNGAAHPLFWAGWTVTGLKSRKSMVPESVKLIVDANLPVINPIPISEDAGGTSSFYYRARAYDLGIGEQRNATAAAALYEKASNGGDMKATAILSQMYRHADGVSKDEEKAASLEEMLQRKATEKTWFQLGGIFSSSSRSPERMKFAVSCFEKAAAGGLVAAQTELYLRYKNGIGVEKNELTAVKWLTMAAEQNDADAAYVLATLYADGEGVNKSNGQAAKWFERAAKNGSAQAMRILASWYLYGYAINVDLDKARYWHKRAIASDLGESPERIAKFNRDLAARSKVLTSTDVASLEALASLIDELGIDFLLEKLQSSPDATALDGLIHGLGLSRHVLRRSSDINELWFQLQARNLDAPDSYVSRLINAAKSRSEFRLSTSSVDQINGPIQFRLFGHNGSINVVASSFDGELMASGDENGVLKIWDARTHRLLSSRNAHKGAVTDLKFTPDSSILLSGGKDKSVKAWVRDDDSNEFRYESKYSRINFPFWTHQLAISPDGNLVSVAAGSKSIAIWRLDTNKVIKKFKAEVDCECVAFSPDGTRFAAGMDDGKVWIWDTINWKNIVGITANDYPIQGLVFTADGSLFLSDNKWIMKWNQSGKLVFKIPTDDQVRSLTYSEDGSWIAGRSRHKNLVKVWDARTGELQQSYKGHFDWADWFAKLSLSLDETSIASGSSSGDRSVVFRDLSTARPNNRVINPHTSIIKSLDLSPDGKHLVSSAVERIVIWDRATNRPLSTISDHVGSVYCVAVSPNGQKMASAGKDKTVCIWSMPDGRLEKKIKLDDRVQCVAFHPSGRFLAAAGNDNVIRMWSLSDYSLAATLNAHKSTINSIGFSADGRHLVSGGDDRSVKVWNTQSKDLVDSLHGSNIGDGHKSWIPKVGFSSDGRWLASADATGYVIIRDSNTRRQRFKLFHEGGVRSFAFMPDDETIATAGWNRELRIWSLQTGKRIRTYGFDSILTSVVASGDEIIVSDGGGRIHVLKRN